MQSPGTSPAKAGQGWCGRRVLPALAGPSPMKSTSLQTKTDGTLCLWMPVNHPGCSLPLLALPALPYSAACIQRIAVRNAIT